MSDLRKRFDEAKKANDDGLLLFLVGDFYELYYHDAEKAANILGLTLRHRDKDHEVPMTGFPCHQISAYAHKLLASGEWDLVCIQSDGTGVGRYEKYKGAPKDV